VSRQKLFDYHHKQIKMLEENKIWNAKIFVTLFVLLYEGKIQHFSF